VVLRLEPVAERQLRGVPVVADGDALVFVPPTVGVRLEGGRTPVAAADSGAVRAFVPAEALEGLAAGQERRVPIRLRGLPALVRGFAAVDSVTVRRPAPAARVGAGTR
jgi:hypothetical protein